MEKGSIDSFSDSSEFVSEREHQGVAADYRYRSGKFVPSMDGVTVVEEPTNTSDSS